MKVSEEKLKQKRLKQIASIQNMKGARQWKAAKEFALEVNPELRAENAIHMKELETLREEQDNDEARSAGGTLRFAVSIPATIVNVIRQFDPNFLIYDKHDKSKYKTKRSSNREARVLMKVFPEYKIPRKG